MPKTMQRPEQKKLIVPDKYLRHRGVISGVTVRNVQPEERSAEFVAATENGVDTWFGPEYLDMDGIELKRYKKNPLLLDSHNRGETLSVIGGNTKTWIEDRKLIVKPFFASHDKADDIYNLVKDNFVRMLSIGYIIVKSEEIQKGESAKLGTKTIKGPAIIGRKWFLLEISTVAIGADPDALKRNFDGFDLCEARGLLKRLNTFITEKENIMAKGDFENELNRSAEESGEETPPEENDAETGDETPPEENDDETGDETGDETPPEETDPDEPEEDARKMEIYAITPRGLERVAHECVLDNLSVKESKKKLKKALTRSMKPVGTPDSEDVDADREEKDKKNTDKDDATKEVTEDVLERTVFPGRVR